MSKFHILLLYSAIVRRIPVNALESACYVQIQYAVIDNIAGGTAEDRSPCTDFLYSYPSATSRTIITLNPTAKKTVPMLECSPWDISGISSSTTT